MKAVLEFFDGSWPQILGFTLLHSVWEAFLVSAIVVLVLRFIPNKFSTARYITASLGLMSIVLLSIGTLIYLHATSEFFDYDNKHYCSSQRTENNTTDNTHASRYISGSSKRFHTRLLALVSNGMDFWNIAFFSAHIDRVSLCGKT